MKVTKILAIILVMIMLFASCTGNTQSLSEGKPEDVGINKADIEKAVSTFNDKEIEIHSLLVLKDGKMVHEEYFNGYDKNKNHYIASITKSFTSIMTGIAIDEGLLKLDDKAISFFPEENFAKNEKVEAMEVKHLLGMVTGHIRDSAEFVISDTQEGPIKTFFEFCDVTMTPGEYFYYDNGAPFVMSAIIQKVTGKTLFEYAKEKLFEPLDIKDIKWEEYNNTSIGGWGIEITPLGLAKLGQLIVDGGKWNGKQIVSEEYIKQATSKQYDTVEGREDQSEDWVAGYGYYFWMCDTENMFRADGAGGQFIVMDPVKKLVVVVTEETEDAQSSLNIIKELMGKIN